MPQFSNVTQAEEFSVWLKSGLDDIFEDSLPQHDKTYKSIIQETKAKEYVEDAKVITGLGPMGSKQVGGAITIDKPYQGATKTYPLLTWGLGFVAEYELIRWDRYSIFGDATKELAKSAVDRCNIQAYAIFNNFFSTSNSVYTVYNGEAMSAVSHALLGGGTTSNRDASDSALSYTALQNARTLFMRLKNERGRYVMTNPRVLAVESGLEWYAQTLLKSTLRPETANNDKNVLPSFSVHQSPYFSSTTAWFLLASKKDLRIKFRIGDDPVMRKGFDAQTFNTTFVAYMSNRAEVLHYQGTVASQGDGSI